MVLSRAIARDLFDGQALAKAMAFITIATAAAPGFSPLLGSAFDHFLGWRSEFAFVAIFAICALLAYATLIGETNWSANGSVNPLAIAGSYLGLIRDARFLAPARTAGLTMAGLFAIFSAAPRVLLEHYGFAPVTLGLMFASVVVLVLVSSMLAPKLSAALGHYRATLIGLGFNVAGAVALLVAVLVAKDSFPPFIVSAAIFLFGVGIVSPLASAAALSPFADKAGITAALFGFAQMGGAACGAMLAAVVSSDPALGLAIVLAVASPLAMILHGRDGRRSEQRLELDRRCAGACRPTLDPRHRRSFALVTCAARVAHLAGGGCGPVMVHVHPAVWPEERPSSRLDARSLVLITVVSCLCLLASLWAASSGVDLSAAMMP